MVQRQLRVLPGSPGEAAGPDQTFKEVPPSSLVKKLVQGEVWLQSLDRRPLGADSFSYQSAASTVCCERQNIHTK